MYIKRFVDGGFIDSRSSTFLGFENIRLVSLHFIYILEAVTALALVFFKYLYLFNTLYALRIEPE